MISTQLWPNLSRPLREKCPNTEFFLVHIFLYSDWYGDLVRKSPYQSEYRKIWTRKNFVFGHFSRSGHNIKLDVRVQNLPGLYLRCRCIYSELCCLNTVMKNFAIFTRNHLQWRPFSRKLQDAQVFCKRLHFRYFPVILPRFFVTATE